LILGGETLGKQAQVQGRENNVPGGFEAYLGLLPIIRRLKRPKNFTIPE
jgi:hypothetical protein